MSDVSDAINEARSELAGEASEFMAGSCAIIKNTPADGGANGDTLTPSAGPSGIPYEYKSSGPQTEIVVGGESHPLSHWLKMPFTNDVLAIKPEDRIQDADNSAMIFQDPVIVYDSKDVFVRVAATLVRQGY
jgi:hypothetical protein